MWPPWGCRASASRAPGYQGNKRGSDFSLVLEKESILPSIQTTIVRYYSSRCASRALRGRSVCFSKRLRSCLRVTSAESIQPHQKRTNVISSLCSGLPFRSVRTQSCARARAHHITQAHAHAQAPSYLGLLQVSPSLHSVRVLPLVLLSSCWVTRGVQSAQAINSLPVHVSNRRLVILSEEIAVSASHSQSR
jgi:hypothetical protein